MTSAQSQAQASQPHADAGEIKRFDALSHRFWDPKGEFRPLHLLNPVRFAYVRERAALAGAAVLDVGCGGGLLCESLATAGAKVTGIDLAAGMVEAARLHAIESGIAIDYRIESAEALAARAPGSFDVVTCMEMLEHVPSPAGTLAALSRLVKPGGAVFVSTLHRNLRSFLMAIVGAEYVLGLIPRGTHQYEKLIRPSELARWGRACGLELKDLSGLDFDPLSSRCTLSENVSVNYLAWFVRGDALE
jgi:2-polyprenyl-6-hydroxyphenyl methylase/3-demethylubiquinone-9 3-methyltransferase